ncbi:MAG: tRNA (N(6)-L-threonylcarbamoyladenosine(37)-C(2))-methylthiotransferase MtaB [Clostridia bacterium]|nr:tRNA (N(6)-L-threonylcarbamoyladenosine(37)-C(2))-methylthiotransferase MtaB [Clostridia bacterium]
MRSTYRAAICTLGCRVNQYESTAVADELASLGFEMRDFDDVCDVYIINTCAVTAESERKSRQMIRRAHAQNPSAHVIVMGCYSQLHAEAAAKIEGVSYVCGNRNKMSAADAALKLVRGEKIVGDVLDVSHAPLERMRISRSDRTRAYVKIEDGCDNNCAYCIIKKARGAVVSRSISDVCAEIKALAGAGYREVVLTGIEVASFGRDTGEKLSDLIGAVAKVDGIERIRLASLEPSVLTKEFVDALAAEPKFMPSFHLSLQSGSTRVLALMKRKYNIEKVFASVDCIKEKMPRSTFTADIIVGFPQESDDDFRLTCEAAERIGFLHMHIFPFSAREGTVAAEMDGQIPDDEKRRRAACLKKLGDAVSARVYEAALDGRAREVLFETPHGAYQVGHTPEMLEIYVRSGEPLQNEIRRVVPTEYKNGKLYGKLAEE